MVRKVTKRDQKDKQEIIKNDLLFVQVRAIVRLQYIIYNFEIEKFIVLKFRVM